MPSSDGSAHVNVLARIQTDERLDRMLCGSEYEELVDKNIRYKYTNGCFWFVFDHIGRNVERIIATGVNSPALVIVRATTVLEKRDTAVDCKVCKSVLRSLC